MKCTFNLNGAHWNNRPPYGCLNPDLHEVRDDRLHRKSFQQLVTHYIALSKEYELRVIWEFPRCAREWKIPSLLRELRRQKATIIDANGSSRSMEEWTSQAVPQLAKEKWNFATNDEWITDLLVGIFVRYKDKNNGDIPDYSHTTIIAQALYALFASRWEYEHIHQNGHG